MQKAAVAALNSGLKKELLSKTHVSVREDEREAIAFAFVIELRSIAGSDEGHSSNSFKRGSPVEAQGFRHGTMPCSSRFTIFSVTIP
jgi:hypothetical protein